VDDKRGATMRTAGGSRGEKRARNLNLLRRIGARWHRAGLFIDPRAQDRAGVRDAADVLAGDGR
jgi:hypothetical protein